MNENEKALYLLAVEKWGKAAQLGMVVEECSELIDAIQKFIRGRVDERSIVSEACDVELMLKQLEAMMPGLWDECRKEKMDHFKDLLGRSSSKTH